jgi:UDP-glucose 4-epimerase
MTFSRFFVVGGAGFIGSHLVSRLLERGPVTVFDDLSSGTRANLERPMASAGCRLVEASVHDLHALTEAMQRHDVVVHLAEPRPARTGSFAQSDVTMTANVIEAMRRTGARRLIYASSGDVYGATCEFCVEQDLRGLPDSLYGAAKLAGEALVSAFAHETPNARAWVFRMGEVVGPRCRRGPVVDVVRALLAGDGSVLHDDPERTRPFLFVDDCVLGVLFAYDRATGTHQTFNLAPGDYSSMQRALELAAAELGIEQPRLEWQPQKRPGSPLHRRLDASKLDALGWQTIRSSDEAIRAALPAIAAELRRAPEPAREAVYFAER